MRKFIISVLAGVLCFSLSIYNISYMVDDTEINIPWSLVFPIMISIVYGMKAGGISAISGGALYPFLLWPDNGWANIITSISLLILFVLIGYIYDNKIWKSGKLRFLYRAILSSVVFISYLSFAFLFIFNELLALNPPFWTSDTINELSNSIMLKFLIKDTINFCLIIMFSEAFLKLPMIRRLLGLQVDFWMRRNSHVFIASISIALIVWFSFYFLDDILTESNPLQDKAYLILSFMIIFWSGGIIGRFLIQYFESKLKTEKLLQQNEAKLINAQNLAKLGSWELDLHTEVITLSSEHQTLIGEKPQRMAMPLSKYAEKYIVSEDISIIHDRIDFAIKNYNCKVYTVNFKYRIKTNTGEIKHLKVKGKFKEEGIIIGVTQDITESIQFEKVIHEKNETYRRLFESSNVAILILDANFIFIDCNEMATKILERPKKEIIGTTPIDETISPKFQPGGRLSSDMGPKHFDSAMKGNDLHFEWMHLKKDGTEFPLEISLFGFIASKKKNFFVMWKDLTEVKRKGKELKESEIQFKNLFNQSPLAIQIFNPEGRIIEVNKALMKLWGIHEENLQELKEKYNILQDEQSRKLGTMPLVEKAFDGELVSFPYLEYDASTTSKNLGLRNEVGRKRWIYPQAYPVKDEKGKLKNVVLIMEDITKRKKLEIETQKLSTAVEQSSNSICITDLKGNIEYVNPRFTELSGYNLDDVLGKNPRMLDSGTDPDEYYTTLWETIKSGKIWQDESLNKTKNGKLFWVDLTISPIKNEVGKTINYLIIKKDITTLKTNKEKLKKQNIALHQLSDELSEKNRLLIDSKNKFKNLFDKSPVSIWEQDFSETIALLHKKKAETRNLEKYFDENPDFVKKCISKIKILNVNDRTLELIGVKNLEELVSHLRKTNNKTAINCLKNELLSIASGKKDFISENEFIRTDGTILHAIVKSTMIDDKGKNIASIINITERKKVEEELVVAKEKAEESDQLKTEFLNNMSHEIRTPMNGILGFSYLLREPGLSDEKRKNYINIVQNSGKQLLHIIDDILEISKLGTKKVKVVEDQVCLNELLFELFSVFDIKAKENRTPLYLKKGFSDKQSTLLTDKTKLTKILNNLLENSLKFTNVGFIELGYQLKNQEIEIYVKDTGIGIEPEKHEVIFERFSQAEKDLSKKTGGLGLGLSIVKENVELLGGKIRLESKKDDGATFFLTIPYKPVYSKIPVYSKLEEDIQDKYTILLVEDEEVNFLYLETVIKDVIGLECEIIHTKNGLEAVEICKKNNAIDLVLMDLKMPVMNGFEATQQIKEFRSDLPIVAQTAYSTQGEQEKAILAGCDDFISKPISVETIRAMLDKYLVKELKS